MTFAAKLSLLSFWLTWIAASAQACPITIVYADVAFPPYYLADGEAIPKDPGIAVELVNLAAAKMDCKINWQRLPNKRVQHEMETGRADAMLLFSFNEERAGFAVYPMKGGTPDPALRLTALTYRIYVKAGSPLQWDGKQFSNLNGALGANSGYSIAKELLKSGVSLEEAPGTENNLKKLQLGRIAGYVMQDLPADTVIEDKEIKDINKLSIPYSTKDYYLPFSKKFYSANQANVQRLWNQIAEIRKLRGKELLKKYSELN